MQLRYSRHLCALPTELTRSHAAGREHLLSLAAQGPSTEPDWLSHPTQQRSHIQVRVRVLKPRATETQSFQKQRWRQCLSPWHSSLSQYFHCGGLNPLLETLSQQDTSTSVHDLRLQPQPGFILTLGTPAHSRNQRTGTWPENSHPAQTHFLHLIMIRNSSKISLQLQLQFRERSPCCFLGPERGFRGGSPLQRRAGGGWKRGLLFFHHDWEGTRQRRKHDPALCSAGTGGVQACPTRSPTKQAHLLLALQRCGPTRNPTYN